MIFWTSWSLFSNLQVPHIEMMPRILIDFSFFSFLKLGFNPMAVMKAGKVVIKRFCSMSNKVGTCGSHAGKPITDLEQNMRETAIKKRSCSCNKAWETVLNWAKAADGTVKRRIQCEVTQYTPHRKCTWPEKSWQIYGYIPTKIQKWPGEITSVYQTEQHSKPYTSLMHINV